MDSSKPTQRHNRLLLLGIIALAVLLRFAAGFYLGDQVVDLPGTADQISYHSLALRLIEGHGFSFEKAWWPMTAAGAPTAHWSYLYTFFLAAVYTLVGPHPLAARLLQAVLVGIIHPYLAFWLGKKLYNEKVGLFAAGLTAVYTYFIYYSAVLMTEPFYIVGILISLIMAIVWVEQQNARSKPGWDRRSIFLAGGLGLVLGITVLLRQVFLLFLPFLFGWMWWSIGRRTNLKSMMQLFIPIAILGLVILPFTVFNYVRFQRFVLLNTNAGFAFYWANHPVYGSHFEPILPPEMGSYSDLIPKELRRLDEASLDSELLKRGIAFVMDDPKRYLLLSISRIPAYFMFWPSADSGLISNLSRVAGFGLMLPFMLYGLVDSFLVQPRRGKFSLSSPKTLLLLFIVIYSLIHILTWSLIRYRLPVDAVLLIFAGLAFYRLFLWLFRGISPIKAGNLA